MHNAVRVKIFLGFKDGTSLANKIARRTTQMGRVEPDDTQPIRRSEIRGDEKTNRGQQRSVGHTPGKAEGEERDVEEALDRETPEA